MRKVVLVLLIAALGTSVTTSAASTTREFAWEYDGRIWTLAHTFSLNEYQRYRTIPRVSSYTAYATYVLEPADDATLAVLVAGLNALAVEGALDTWGRLNLVVSFVQSLRYTTEEGEYPRYPIETLVEGCGDCEDLAILTAALFQQMGYDVVLLAFTSEMHMAVGVRVPSAVPCGGAAYQWNGAAYYYIETTGIGWTIGTMPERYTSTPEIIAVSATAP